MKKYFQAPWSLKDLIMVFAIIGALLGISLVGMYIAKIESPIEVIFLLQWMLITAPLIIFTFKKYGFKWKHFGFRRIGAWKTIKLVVNGFLLYLGITFVISLIILYTNIKIPGYQMQEQILPLFGNDTSGIITAGIIIILLAPFLEELFFRGFLLRTLLNKVGIIYGSVLSALIFAAFHVQWQSIIPIFILGLIINSIVIKSRSIWPAIFFHIFNNAAAFTLQILILKEVISLENLV